VNIKNVFYADEWLALIFKGKIVPTYNDILVSEFRRVKELYPQLRDCKLTSDNLYYNSLAKYLGITKYEQQKKEARQRNDMSHILYEEDIFEQGQELLFENEINEMFKALTNTCIGTQGNKMPIFQNKDSLGSSRTIVQKIDVVRFVKIIERVDPGLFKRVRLNKEYSSLVSSSLDKAVRKFKVALSRKFAHAGEIIEVISNREVMINLGSAYGIRGRWSGGRGRIRRWKRR